MSSLPMLMQEVFVDDIIKKFELNIPQARALTVMANEMWITAGRGFGKTQGIIAPWLLHKVEVMPRSSGGLVGQSYEDIETRILKPIFSAFTMLGLEENVDYVYGKRPPENWEKPLIPVIKYDRVLSFPNGTTLELISLAKKGSANGLSLQWLIGDEAKFLDEQKLKQEVFPILRGNVDYFGQSAWYGAKLFVTDKLHPNIHWILAKKDLMKPKVVNSVIRLQLQANGLRTHIQTVSVRTAYTLKKKLVKLENALTKLRKNLVYYGEGSALDNIKNLSPDYFKNQKNSMTWYEYLIQILNRDPIRAENGFYPDRAERHLYCCDLDDDTTKPLGIVLDYQASISPLVSFQINDRLSPGSRTLNILENFYALYPQGLRHVVDQFCERHKNRTCKRVYYFFDHTAVGRKAGHKKFYEEVVEYFVANGWGVQEFYMGAAPLQNDKYRRIKYYLSNVNKYPYQIRLHKNRCATLLIAMDMTETLETIDQGTKKNKYRERDLSFPQEKATHLPDCFDQIIWAVYEKNMYPSDSTISMVGGFR